MEHLAFLNEIRINPDEKSPTAPWLLSGDFYKNTWTLLGSGNEDYTFNWNKIMPTGISLSSNGIEDDCVSSKILPYGDVSEDPHYIREKDYRNVLNLLKRIAFYLRHRRVTRRCSRSFHTQFFNELIVFTEWVFLNDLKFKPIEHLFELVDSSDLQDEYIPLWVSGGKSELLKIEERIKISLKEILVSIREDTELLCELERCQRCTSRIKNIDSIMLPFLMFTEEETRLLRAWLHKNQYYYNAKHQAGILKVQSLLNDLIHQNVKSDTLPPLLQAKLRTLCAVENSKVLDFSPKSIKEFFPAGELRILEEVKAPRGLCMSRLESIKVFFGLLKKISRYIKEGMPNPSMFKHISFDNIDTENLRPPGSTKTIPPEVAIHCLGEAVGFVVNFGDELVDFASKVKSEVSKSRNSSGLKNTPPLSYLSKYDKTYIPSFACIPEGLKPLNIVQLGSVFEDSGHPKFNDQGGNARAEILRNCMGLEDALNLLIASTIIIVGTTAARRQIEIKTLDSRCLEKILGTGWYLRFKLGKDTFGGSKGMPARCIPNIAARSIKLIQKLNKFWQMDHDKTSEMLFFGYSGSLTGCKILSTGIYNRLLDCFCDFAEVPLDDEGKRWYIRTHQMRRFWAYSFFYKMGLGELHTIGWFLGHTEAEHTWAYIRESFDGHDKEMQRIKAAYAADILKGNHIGPGDNDSAIEYIKSLVFTHFNRSQIELVQKDELIDYLSELVKEDKLDIEPKFIRDTKGTDYDLIWLVNEGNNYE
jgi:hypothetical protein